MYAAGLNLKLETWHCQTVKIFPNLNSPISTVSYILKHLNLTNGYSAMNPGQGRKRTETSQANIKQIRQILETV